MRKPSLVKLISPFLIGLFLLTFIPFARAGVSSTETYMVSGDPGEEIELKYSFVNLDDEPSLIKLRVVDAKDGAHGAFILLTSDDYEQTQIGLWGEIDGAPENGTLEQTAGAKEKITGTFRIKILENATPGVYAGAIVATQYPLTTEEGMSVITGAVGSRIYLQVNGEQVVDFSWDSFSFNNDLEGPMFVLSLNNKGNVMLEPKVVLDLSNFFGIFKSEVSNNLGLLTPGNGGDFKIKWEKAPLLAFGSAKATVTYSQKSIMSGDSDGAVSDALEKTTGFMIIPVKELIASLVVFVITFALFYRRYRKYSKAINSYVSYNSKKDEPLAILAAHYGVDWKFLAKINKIKAPYIVFKGQQILVPPKAISEAVAPKAKAKGKAKK